MVRGLGKVSEALGNFRYPPYKVSKQKKKYQNTSTWSSVQIDHLNSVPSKAEALSRVRWIIENRWLNHLESTSNHSNLDIFTLILIFSPWPWSFHPDFDLFTLIPYIIPYTIYPFITLTPYNWFSEPSPPSPGCPAFFFSCSELPLASSSWLELF